MGKEIKDFRNKFEFMSILFTNSESFYINDGYKIVKSSYLPTGTFLTLKKNGTNIRSNDFCLQVISADDGHSPDVFEMDLIKYSIPEMRTGYGAVGYDKEKYMWIVKDIDDKKSFPLYKCKIEKILGNLCKDPDLLEHPLENVQTQPRDSLYAITTDFPDVIQRNEEHDEHQYAALDEEVPGLGNVLTQKDSGAQETAASPVHVYASTKNDAHGKVSWYYCLESDKGSKSDCGLFNKQGMEPQYYFFACANIALTQLRKPKSIVLHTPIKGLNNMVNSLTEKKLDVDTWKYKNGVVPQNETKSALKDLQSTLMKLNVPLSTEFIDKTYLQKKMEKSNIA